MGDILVGSASWADKSLIDSRLFYPKEAKTAEARLRYYATHFALVEVDSSYYAIPAPQVAELWAQRTPQAFVFELKAFRIFTQHQTRPQALPKDIQEGLGPLAEKKNVYYADFPPELMDEMWRRFKLALEPLKRAGKLGAVLFQFPPGSTTGVRTWRISRTARMSWTGVRSVSSFATERGLTTSTEPKSSPSSGSTAWLTWLWMSPTASQAASRQSGK